MTLIKHYPRQAHTQIQIIVGNGQQVNLAGLVTEISLHDAHGGLFLEINSFATPQAEDPTCSEIMPFFGFSIIAKEDPPPQQGVQDNGKPVQDAEARPAKDQAEHHEDFVPVAPSPETKH